MIKTYTWAWSILGVLVATGLLYTQYAEADNAEPSFEVSFGTSAIQIEDGKSYQIAGSEGSLDISTLSPLSSVISSELFKHQDGADNLLFASNDQSLSSKQVPIPWMLPWVLAQMALLWGRYKTYNKNSLRTSYRLHTHR